MQKDTILLFDSVCIFCERSVHYALRHEKAPSIKFVSLQSDFGRKLAREHNIDPDSPETFLFLEGGTAHAKSDGVMALARHLNGFASRLAAIGRFVPKPIRDFAYDQVVRNRYRIFGKKNACMAPPPASRWRFIL